MDGRVSTALQTIEITEEKGENEDFPLKYK